jgi:hypothetical protein
VDRAIDGESHRDGGNHGGSHIDFQPQPAEEPHDHENRQRVGYERDEGPANAAEGDEEHHRHASDRDGKTGPLVAQQALNQPRQQDKEAGDFGGWQGLFVRGGRERGLRHAGHFIDELPLLLGLLAFSGAEHDAEPATTLFVLPLEGTHEGGHHGGHPLDLELGRSGSQGRVLFGSVENVDQADDLGQRGRVFARMLRFNLDAAELRFKIADLEEVGFVQDIRGGNQHIPDAGPAEMRFHVLISRDHAAAGAEVAGEVGFDFQTQRAEACNRGDEDGEEGGQLGTLLHGGHHVGEAKIQPPFGPGAVRGLLLLARRAD